MIAGVRSFFIIGPGAAKEVFKHLGRIALRDNDIGEVERVVLIAFSLQDRRGYQLDGSWLLACKMNISEAADEANINRTICEIIQGLAADQEAWDVDTPFNIFDDMLISSVQRWGQEGCKD